MSFIKRFKEKLKGKPVEDKINQEVAESFAPIKDALLRGESNEATTRALETGTMKSDEFYSIIGALDQYAGIAIFQAYLKNANDKQLNSQVLNEEEYNHLWKSFEYAQKDCMDFFVQTIEMRNWVTARSLKKLGENVDWKFVDSLMVMDPYWASEYRQESWWRVPFIFYVVQAVEDRHGPGSCTSKRWQAAHEDLYSKETIMSMIKSLTEDEISYYRCTD